jgi:hypothetical protein
MNTPVIRPRIIVEAPTADIQPGRGFYQLEEDALHVQIAEYDRKRRMFSFLESEKSRLDFDRTGKLIFIELMVPRRQWTVWQDFRVPEHARPAVLRWVDFRKPLKPPQLFTDPHRLHLCMEFGGDDGDEVYRIAGSVLVGGTGNRGLSQIHQPPLLRALRLCD